MHHAPRSLLIRSAITVEITPTELHNLVRLTEAEAIQAEADGHLDFADFLFRRVAELREAGR